MMIDVCLFRVSGRVWGLGRPPDCYTHNLYIASETFTLRRHWQLSVVGSPLVPSAVHEMTWDTAERQHVQCTCSAGYMRISMNHNSLGCEQPSRPGCRTITQCAGRVSANARLRWGDQECGCFTPCTYNTDGWPYHVLVMSCFVGVLQE